MTTLQLLSPAKLNLHLEVLRRRKDGFHDLETLMTTVSICDSIRFSFAGDNALSFNCRWRLADHARNQDNLVLGDLPQGKDNLIHQAAKMLRTEALQTSLSAESADLVQKNVKIDVVKRIPSGGGLGGASSNAATTLMGLSRLWKLGWSQERLREIAAQIGSDVSFFIFGKTAICRGRGELVTPLNVARSAHVVIVRPPMSLSTQAVFQSLGETDYQTKSIAPILQNLNSGNISAMARQLFNRLEKAAANLSDWISLLRSEFSALGIAGHQLTGSGSCYFGICSNRRKALQLYHQLIQRRLGSVYLCRSNI